VSIDAIPKKKFKGVVTEIGNNALLRSTGVATSQSTGGAQEAKDFKVVVTLEEVPENLRPGLSTTARITTAIRTGALSIPIQALTIRQRGDLRLTGDGSAVEAAEKPLAGSAAQTAAQSPAQSKEELQGVFVVRGGRAHFVPVQTGIMGASDIEVLVGLTPGDEIVTGSYKALRTLKPEGRIRVDNSAPKKDDKE
jgi:HlyD family secretion protein